MTAVPVPTTPAGCKGYGARFLVGDVFERLAELPDGSVDLVLTSPPFLALRSYLPADHPDKGQEIGSEATPAEYLDVLLQLTAEWGRVLAPHGSLAVELGDTYSGSGGAGGDYNPNGLREGQGKFAGSATNGRRSRAQDEALGILTPRPRPGPGQRDDQAGWPLDKSLTFIPQLYGASLAYGRNVLTGEPSPAGQWRVRNVKPWIRTNPPVGALGDKDRPATSYVVVATRARDRWFDLDAARVPNARADEEHQRTERHRAPERGGERETNEVAIQNVAGAPPRDWWHHVDAILDACLDQMATKPERTSERSSPKTGADGRGGGWSTLAETGVNRQTGARGHHLRRALEAAGILTTLDAMDISPKGYAGSHYAVWPPELCRLLIDEMCPRRVCVSCGQPSRRITNSETENEGRWTHSRVRPDPYTPGNGATSGQPSYRTNHTTTGWSSCGCPGTDGLKLDGFHTGTGWRPGVVLDPFVGSGTTLAVASGMGRDSIGIDLDSRNAELARERVGMFLTVDDGSLYDGGSA